MQLTPELEIVSHPEPLLSLITMFSEMLHVSNIHLFIITAMRSDPAELHQMCTVNHVFNSAVLFV